MPETGTIHNDNNISSFVPGALRPARAHSGLCGRTPGALRAHSGLRGRTPGALRPAWAHSGLYCPYPKVA